MPDRIACLYVPDFPLAARLRSDPALAQEPVAVVDGKGSHALVIAAAGPAARAGVRPGFSIPQARALLPSTAFKARDAAAERAAQAALVETAEAFSPRVEEAGAGVVFLDMCNERRESMLVELAVRRARVAGLPVRAGVAGSKLAAFVAAEEGAGGPIVVPPGGEAAFLAPLPVRRLRTAAGGADEETLATLARWGLKTVGAFASLPERDVMVRLGREGWDLQRAARGVDPRPLVPRAHPADYAEGVELEWPIPDLAAFDRIAGGLLDRLMARLAASDLAARAISMTMTIDPVGADARRIPLPAPSRDVRSILALLAFDIERAPPAGPVIGLSFTAAPERAARAQLSLFDPPAMSPDALNATLARLAALVGPDRFGSPAVVAGHRPEVFSLEAFNPPPPENRTLFEKEAAPGDAPGAAVAVRVLRPKVELEVRLPGRAPDGDADGLSRGPAAAGGAAFVRSLHNDGSRPEIVGEVRVASGPWRIEEGWWLGAPVLRDYWDVELSDGGLYRIYHDPVKDRWFADGIYD